MSENIVVNNAVNETAAALAMTITVMPFLTAYIAGYDSTKAVVKKLMALLASKVVGPVVSDFKAMVAGMKATKFSPPEYADDF